MQRQSDAFGCRTCNASDVGAVLDEAGTEEACDAITSHIDGLHLNISLVHDSCRYHSFPRRDGCIHIHKEGMTSKLVSINSISLNSD